MTNDFNVLIKAILDTRDIKGDVSKLEKELAKKKIDLQAVIDTSGNKKLLQEYAAQIQEIFKQKGIDIDISKIISSLNQVYKQAETVSSKVSKIQLSIDNGYGTSKYQNQINKTISSLQQYGAEAQVIEKINTDLQSAFNSMKGLSGQELIDQATIFKQKLDAAKVSIDEAKQSYDKFFQPVSGEKVTSLILRIQNFLSKNTSITKSARTELENYIIELKGGNVSLERWDQVSNKLKETENSMRVLGKLGKTFKDQWSQAISSFSTWLSASAVVMKAVSETKEAISELKEVNTLLTEISKANDALSKSELAQIGNNAFETASKYGKTATDYLSGVQEASRAGYENAEGIAELSVAAQGAGDMTAELANQMIIATDKAYKMNGSVSELTKVLDGMNYITNHNAVNMTELSEGMSIVGSTAASFGVDVNETTAALGTMIATTQQSGSEAAHAFRAILLNIRQVSDEEEGIDAEGLTKYEQACAALNVSLKETKNGVLSLRDPMEVLKELSVEYNKLEGTDIRRTNLLSSVGGKLRATQLDALLRQWDTYEAMLQQYTDGTGSMATEAEKTANSWEGSLNRLSNTWTDTVGNIANSDAIITIINGLNGLLGVINDITGVLKSSGTIGAGLGIALNKMLG